MGGGGAGVLYRTHKGEKSERAAPGTTAATNSSSSNNGNSSSSGETDKKDKTGDTFQESAGVLVTTRTHFIFLCVSCVLCVRYGGDKKKKGRNAHRTQPCCSVRTDTWLVWLARRGDRASRDRARGGHHRGVLRIEPTRRARPLGCRLASSIIIVRFRGSRVCVWVGETARVKGVFGGSVVAYAEMMVDSSAEATHNLMREASVPSPLLRIFVFGQTLVAWAGRVDR